MPGFHPGVLPELLSGAHFRIARKKGPAKAEGRSIPPWPARRLKALPYSLKLTPTAKVRPFLYSPIGAYFTSLYQ